MVGQSVSAMEKLLTQKNIKEENTDKKKSCYSRVNNNAGGICPWNDCVVTDYCDPAEKHSDVIGRAQQLK